jgi:hypothetical protein
MGSLYQPKLKSGEKRGIWWLKMYVRSRRLPPAIRTAVAVEAPSDCD